MHELSRGLLLGLGRGALSVLGRSLSVTEVNREIVERLWASRSPIIYAAWHGRLLMVPWLYRHTRPVHILASRSRDGEILSRFAESYGFRAVRGSSSRGGPIALRALVKLLRAERAEVAIAPDGPRGPRYVAQAGAVLLAKLGRAPIVPLAYGASRRTVLRSWDEFVVPHPFARAVVVFGDPVIVPEDADRAALDACRVRLGAELNRVTREADRRSREAVKRRHVPAL